MNDIKKWLYNKELKQTPQSIFNLILNEGIPEKWLHSASHIIHKMSNIPWYSQKEIQQDIGLDKKDIIQINTLIKKSPTLQDIIVNQGLGRKYWQTIIPLINTGAIQNVLEQDLQIQTIENLGNFLKDDGLMVLVESSADAQKRLNLARKKYDLHEIIPPFHNLFFDDERLKNHEFKSIKLVEISPFASDFYYITRLIYARYAKEFLKEKTNYDHPLEKIANSMSENQHTKDFSQIQTYIFKKK